METGKKHSKDPISPENAKAQLRILMDAERKGGVEPERVNPRGPRENSVPAKVSESRERLNKDAVSSNRKEKIKDSVSSNRKEMSDEAYLQIMNESLQYKNRGEEIPPRDLKMILDLLASDAPRYKFLMDQVRGYGISQSKPIKKRPPPQPSAAYYAKHYITPNPTLNPLFVSKKAQKVLEGSANPPRDPGDRVNTNKPPPFDPAFDPEPEPPFIAPWDPALLAGAPPPPLPPPPPPAPLVPFGNAPMPLMFLPHQPQPMGTHPQTFPSHPQHTLFPNMTQPQFMAALGNFIQNQQQAPAAFQGSGRTEDSLKEMTKLALRTRDEYNQMKKERDDCRRELMALKNPSRPPPPDDAVSVQNPLKKKSPHMK